jgi:hypothetical protein
VEQFLGQALLTSRLNSGFLGLPSPRTGGLTTKKSSKTRYDRHFTFIHPSTSKKLELMSKALFTSLEKGSEGFGGREVEEKIEKSFTFF